MCMYVCMYACMHARMHAWMDGWMDSYVCVCIYIDCITLQILMKEGHLNLILKHAKQTEFSGTWCIFLKGMTKLLGCVSFTGLNSCEMLYAIQTSEMRSPTSAPIDSRVIQVRNYPEPREQHTFTESESIRITC